MSNPDTFRDFIEQLVRTEEFAIRVIATLALCFGVARLFSFELLNFFALRLLPKTATIRLGDKSVELNLDDEASVSRGIEELSKGNDGSRKAK